MDSKIYLTQKIPTVFNDDGTGKIYPDGHMNDVQYWGNFPREKLHEILPDGTPRLRMLDIDVGDKCSLACPHCFRRDPRIDVVNDNALTLGQIIDYIKEAKDLGLESLKILGRGEPFENKEFLTFLRKMTELDIGVAAFTKGHVLGSDELARHFNPDLKNAQELVAELKKLKFSALLGFNTFNDTLQTQMVGTDKLKDSHLLGNFPKLRNNALVNLADAGFNEYKDGEATRLCVMTAPFTPETIDEVFDIYRFMNERNIHTVVCPTTQSGKGLDTLNRQKENYDFDKYMKRVQQVYADIYKYAIKSNLIPLEKFKQEGVSLYAGARPCNQVAAGMYLNLSGQVVQCPGRFDEETIITKDIRKSTLKDVWSSSPNAKRAKDPNGFNYRCVARDGHSLPKDFYSNIEELVLNHFEKNN